MVRRAVVRRPRTDATHVRAYIHGVKCSIPYRSTHPDLAPSFLFPLAFLFFSFVFVFLFFVPYRSIPGAGRPAVVLLRLSCFMDRANRANRSICLNQRLRLPFRDKWQKTQPSAAARAPFIRLSERESKSCPTLSHAPITRPLRASLFVLVSDRDSAGSFFRATQRERNRLATRSNPPARLARPVNSVKWRTRLKRDSNTADLTSRSRAAEVFGRARLSRLSPRVSFLRFKIIQYPSVSWRLSRGSDHE